VLIAVFGDLSEILALGSFRVTLLFKKKVINNVDVFYIAVFNLDLFNVFAVHIACK